MARSLHETRNPMEVSAKVQACMVLELDYKLNCFTADDGEKAFTLEIPELAMDRIFNPVSKQIAKPKTPKVIQLGPDQIRKLLDGLQEQEE